MRDAFRNSVTILVTASAKDGKQRANGLDLTLPDGKRLFLASSAQDAPNKGK